MYNRGPAWGPTIRHAMKTYFINGIQVRVYNCPGYRLASVLNLDGFVCQDIMTHAYGKRAASLAYSEARRFRKI